MANEAVWIDLEAVPVTVYSANDVRSITMNALSIQSGARDYAEGCVKDGTRTPENPRYVAESVLLDAWGQGCVEWRDFIHGVAIEVTRAERLLDEVFLKFEEDWPSCFEYSVVEEVGEAMAEFVMSADWQIHGNHHLKDVGLAELVRQLLVFVSECDAETQFAVAAGAQELFGMDIWQAVGQKQGE